MSYSDVELKQNLENPRRARKRSGTGWVQGLVAVLLWGGLVFGGFYFTKNYLDTALQNVQQTNAMSVQAINERLDILSSDMQDLKDLLSSADETISSSGSLQQELAEKIKTLEEQMENLEDSLKVLQEAPNGSR